MRKYGINIFNIDLNNSYIFLVYKTDFKIIPVTLWLFLNRLKTKLLYDFAQ